MKEYIDLNCDMGESFYEKKVGNDEAIMPYITSCNVACGFHGGDPKTIIKTVELAIKNNVKVGAHPSLYDLKGFGRRRMKINEGELISLLIYQISSLYGISKYLGTNLHHVKVHGALYNMASEDDQIARLIVNTVSEIDPNLKIYGPSMLKWRIIAEEGGLEYVSEVFSDRNYNDDLTLVDRKNQNAIINNKDLGVEHVMRMVKQNKVKTINGNYKEIKAQTVCIHGDQKHAVSFAQNISEELSKINLYEKKF
ncbi:MAG: lactam utilization protein LamB [Flammeovirgaceae bacterium]|nr:lactam utilization protein LamB [Flammeovirgaceae bacterium]|tara:strand:- start:1223 stop:1981 length:759 start_codon:yes stop_codon:yes gene_type:complete